MLNILGELSLINAITFYFLGVFLCSLVIWVIASKIYKIKKAKITSTFVSVLIPSTIQALLETKIYFENEYLTFLFYFSYLILAYTLSGMFFWKSKFKDSLKVHLTWILPFIVLVGIVTKY
jgi:hypothetical protein